MNEDTKNSSIEYSKDKLIFSLSNMRNYFVSVLFFFEKKINLLFIKKEDESGQNESWVC